jgi:hypothetical protein
MSRRLFIFMVALLCVLGSLLLLSALIESPAAEPQAEQEELPAAHTITAFVSMPPTPTSASAFPLSVWLKTAALFAAAIIFLPRLDCACDANGRVVCDRSYIRSYHPVFRQEFACG